MGEFNVRLTCHSSFITDIGSIPALQRDVDPEFKSRQRI